MATAIHMQVPSTSGPEALYSLASSPSSAAFSLEATTVTVVQSSGADTVPVLGSVPACSSLPLPPEPLADRDHEDDAEQRRDDQWDG